MLGAIARMLKRHVEAELARSQVSLIAFWSMSATPAFASSLSCGVSFARSLKAQEHLATPLHAPMPSGVCIN